MGVGAMFGSLFQRLRFTLFPPDVVVDIEAGEPVPRRGKVKRGFLEDCSEIARDYGIRNGRICGNRQHGQIALRFSRSIPPAAHQRLRNAWHFHR
jgi:hypothetical protein